MSKTSSWIYHNPVRVVCGSLDVLAQYVAAQHVLLVTTSGFLKRGVVQRVKEILIPRQVTVWAGVKPNPDLRDLDAATQELRTLGVGCVVGLGGGSALDAAKVLATTIPSPAEPTLLNVFRRKAKTHWARRLPLVAIPTTSGTGAEVTPFATVWDQAECKKYSLDGVFLYPDVAILDFKLTTTLGVDQTLYPALDTISHALESLWNNNKTQFSELYAIKALSVANEALPSLLNVNAPERARRDMQIASAMAGIAISQTRTALAHSISYPLTAHFNVPHGLACSFMLPRLIKYYLQIHPNSNFKSIMTQTVSTLHGINLDDLLMRYLSFEDLLDLNKEMYTHGRADNFSGKLPEILSILAP